MNSDNFQSVNSSSENLNNNNNFQKMNNKSRNYKWILFSVSAIVVIFVLAGAYFIFQSFSKSSEEISGEDVPKSEGEVLSDFDKSPASFYYMVSEKNELVQYIKQGGTSNNNLPILSTVVRYDVIPEKQSIVKENIPIFTYPREKLIVIPRVAISPDKKKLVFADVGLLLFGPSSGYNKHFFPQENIGESVDIQSGTINRMELASPVFSPDSDRIAYFGVFYDENGKETKRQVRILTIDDGKSEVLIENISDYSNTGQQYFPPFAIYPVYWFKDAQGEKLLLEKREIMDTLRPVLITGFLIHDFDKRTTSPITFFIEKDRPIADCPVSNEFIVGRLSAKCNSIPFYSGRSPDGQYRVLSWLDPSDYHMKDFILDFSVLENGGQQEKANIDFQTCYEGTVWSYETGKFICSGFDFNKSKLGKSDSFTYVYSVSDIKNKSTISLFEENIEYVIPPELENNFGLDELLKSKIQKVIGWISGDRFVTLQSSFLSLQEDPYQEEPIKQTLYLTDLKGNKKIIGEYSVDGEITDQEQVFKKLEELNVDKKFIDSLKENKTDIVRYGIKQQIEIDFLGGVEK